MNDPECLIYVVDDDDAVRIAVETLLRSAGRRVEGFACGSEFLASLRSEDPACLLLDVHLPEGSGLDLQRELSLKHPLPIVFMTGHADVPTSVRAIKAGAVEFLLKPFGHEELLAAVELAAAKAWEEWRARRELARLRARLASLTPRERQVLTHVVTGMLNKQIASVLGISEVTVKGHRRQVMQKLEANSVVDLARMAWQVGMSASTQPSGLGLVDPRRAASPARQ